MTEGPQRKGIRWPQAASLSSSKTSSSTSFHLHQRHISLCALLERLPQNIPRLRIKIVLSFYFRRLGQQHFPVIVVIVILKIQKVQGFWPSSSCSPAAWAGTEWRGALGSHQASWQKFWLSIHSSPVLAHLCHLEVCLRGGCVGQPAACGGNVRGGGRGEEHVLGQLERQQDLPWIPSCPPPRERER